MAAISLSGQPRYRELREHPGQPGKVFAGERFPVDVGGNGPALLHHGKNHIPVQRRYLPGVGDMAECPAGREGDLRLTGRVMGSAETDQRHRIDRRSREHALGHGPPGNRVGPLLLGAADLDKERGEGERSRAVVGHFVTRPGNLPDSAGRAPGALPASSPGQRVRASAAPRRVPLPRSSRSRAR